MSQMTEDEARAVLADPATQALMDDVLARASIDRDLARLEEAFEVPALSPSPEQVEESVALGPKAELEAAQLLLVHTKKKKTEARRAMFKTLVAAGVGPQQRRKIGRLLDKGAEGKVQLDALFAEIEAEKLAEV